MQNFSYVPSWGSRGHSAGGHRVPWSATCLPVALPGDQPGTNHLKIFVVEDEREVARLLAEALQLAGHEPVVAYDGPEALALLDHERPDVVFLDVRMPGMSGIDVLRRIRQADGALPVVLLTGHAGEAEVAEARRLGVSEIIRKPRILANLEGILGELQKSGSPPGQSGKVGYPGRIRREGSGCPRADAEPQG